MVGETGKHLFRLRMFSVFLQSISDMATFQILEENEVENVPPKRYKFPKHWNASNVFTKDRLQCLFAILTIASLIITWSVFGSKYNEQSELLINVTTMLSDRIDHIDFYQIPRLDQKIENGAKNTFHSKVASARSCKEYQDHGYKKDGYYLVDPDGRYQGFNSLEVYCENMERRDGQGTLRTIIKPKNVTKRFFTNTSEPQFLRPVYEVSTKQLNTLVKNSGNCYQKIDFRCHKMPLHLPNNQGGVAAWVDYDHTEWTFFDGSDWDKSKCEIENFRYGVKCNCDEYDDHADRGIITAQWLLPIQSFVYDATKKNYNFSKDGTLQVNIGPLVCEEEFNLDVQGPLAKLAQPEIEKIFWNPWDRFELKFSIIKYKSRINSTAQDPRCKKILEILDTSDAKQSNKAFLELTFCHQNVTLTQNINGKMTSITLKSTLLMAQQRYQITADGNKVKMTDFAKTTIEKFFANYTTENSASPKKSKITVWPSFRDKTMLEISDLRLEDIKRWW